MNTRFYISIVALAVAVSVSAFGGSVVSDDFNIPDSEDINGRLGQRQGGSAAPVAYRAVTVGNAEAIANDQIKIENNALAITSAPKKGPASISLNHDFGNLGPRYRFEVTVGTAGSWAGIQLTPVQKGNWPDSSTGLSMIIWPNGTWNVWNNTNQPKQLIGTGRVPQADKFQVAFDVDETSGKTVTISINGVKVLNEKPFTYNGANLYLVLQSNGQTAFDDLAIGMVE